LQLSSLDFAQELREVMGKNPFLEQEETPEGEAEEAAVHAAHADQIAMPVMDDMPSDAPPAGDTLDASGLGQDADGDRSWERDTWQADGLSQRNGTRDKDFNVFDA